MVSLVFDCPSMSLVTLYLITLQISNINSRTSTHWRLCEETGEVSPVLPTTTDNPGSGSSKHRHSTNSKRGHALASDDEIAEEEERVMHILTGPPGKRWQENAVWILESGVTNEVTAEGSLVTNSGVTAAETNCQRSGESSCPYSKESSRQSQQKISSSQPTVEHKIRPTSSNSESSSPKEQSSPESSTTRSNSNTFTVNVSLNCQPYVDMTQYDHLRGVAQRSSLPVYPEPEVIMIFRKIEGKSTAARLQKLEAKLTDSKAKRPKSPQVYNQIGNFLRIHGDSRGAVECFRRALSLSANHPDVLLNLARVLFNHNFLEDAIHLTRRSLETQSPQRNSWLQHFTLGEILKSYGHLQEAVYHFRHALDLNPGFNPAQVHLRDLEHEENPTVTYYTLFIILFLVMGVLCGVLTSIDSSSDGYSDGMKTHSRHFNRGMAMKTLKFGLNPKTRMRRIATVNGSSASMPSPITTSSTSLGSQ